MTPTAAPDPGAPTPVTDADGSRRWYLDGRLHRDDGPAIERADGSLTWSQHGLVHRDDGPAFIGSDGGRFWYRHGQLHRGDGPAVEYPDGARVWWFDDVEVPAGHRAVLDGLVDAGEVDVLVAVTAAWTPDAAIGQLVEAARAALT